MTGLDLESFLLLLRADLATWGVIGLMSLVLAGLVWLSWGSRRALRKCLVASLVAHAGLAYYARTVPAISHALGNRDSDDRSRPHIREIRVTPVTGPQSETETGPSDRPATMAEKTRRSFDRTIEPIELAEPKAEVRKSGTYREIPEKSSDLPQAPSLEAPAPIPVATAVPTPRTDRPTPTFPIEEGSRPTARTEDVPASNPDAPALNLSEADRAEIPEAVPLESPGETPRRDAKSGTVGESLASLPDRSLRAGGRQRPASGPSKDELPELSIKEERPSIPIARAMPSPSMSRGTGRAGESTGGDSGGLADLIGAIGNRPIAEVPPVYRPRLDPNRSAAAKRAGASDASEQAVERALNWLARHQDKDGRWDGGTARDVQGNAVDEDDDFTVHCPPGETCFGECIYWEADTAVTGLSLLTFLGAGYTHRDGRYAGVVENGLQYLVRIQKPNGDLRGRSRAVGMYCHAMAALALCEAYALTGDERLRDPVTRAVEFAVAARAKDGQAWRYAPGEPVGDTSILGWVVMLIKSARESKIPIPDSEGVQAGILKWLGRVASGEHRGLARYQVSEPVTPTMTAEAWVCRQFLGEGGPGPTSDEAARHLLQNPNDRGKTNLYYWYYATLAMYQHGGDYWTRWNDRTRDTIVALQCTSGHRAGSWDPDTSIYGVNGGRIYCTAMAVLTLEVYYRYLRLYDQPSLPNQGIPSPIVPRSTNPRLRPKL